MIYDLPDGRKVVIVQYAIIGNGIQDSLLQWVKERVMAGEDSGIFVEGKWYVQEFEGKFEP